MFLAVGATAKKNKQTNKQKTAVLLWVKSGGLCSYIFKTKPGNSACKYELTCDKWTCFCPLPKMLVK